ncbi:NAD(P)-dependent oxidoreductase [Aneurinibacillus sp. BA2021]|nr:NAD(P)-dependent oxidoreductase [Aneurinibacillus sp. BA2021]
MRYPYKRKRHYPTRWAKDGFTVHPDGRIALARGIPRFIQLSTIVLYDFKSGEPMDETYRSQPEYPIQQISMEREKAVEEAGKEYGMETIMLRPASTIGLRDKKSFFSRLYTAHVNNQFPLAEHGDTRVSLVDARDVGRAMEWLGTYEKPKDDNGIYVLKGFDTTWYDVKKEMDRVTGRQARTVPVSADEQSMMVKNLTVHRVWDDKKIRKLGFHTKYGLSEAVEASIGDLINREKIAHS